MIMFPLFFNLFSKFSIDYLTKKNINHIDHNHIGLIQACNKLLYSELKNYNLLHVIYGLYS